MAFAARGPHGVITPINLAANVIEFLDFGSSLLKDTKEIHRSASGLTVANSDLETVASTLSTLCAGLQTPVTRDFMVNDISNIVISNIARSAREVALEILSYLSRVRARRPDTTHSGRWASVRQALLGICTKDVVAKLEARMTMLRDQLGISLLTFITQCQTQTLSILNEVGKSIDKIFEGRIRSLQDQLTKSNQGNISTFELNKVKLDKLSEHMLAIHSESLKIREENDLLSSLAFDHMYVRESAIADAHEATFEWIFEPNHWPSTDPRAAIRFREWLLGDGSRTYWISGKPGSGKSTLMKYLVHCKQTRQYLEAWASGARLATPSFFFWISGSQMQRSQQGLLQQLLYEILKAFPDMIPLVSDARRERYAASPWTTPKLLQVVESLKGANERGISTTKLCIFIDGLDEYAGDPRDLIKTVQIISVLEGVKLCISSRPWNCFEDAFGSDPSQKLYLHHLTRDDIARYARTGLTEGRPKQDEYSPGTYGRLIEEIVHRAEGVFLWVYLVVKSMREGLSNGDSLDILTERLRELPSDLNEFFRRLIMSVDSVYRRRMSAAIQVALIAPMPLRLLQYKFLDEEGQDLSGNCHSPGTGTPPLSAKQLSQRIDEEEAKVNRQLNGRYKGLLEAKAFPKVRTVDFLHRTVRDYLVEVEMQDFFRSHCGGRFDASMHGCRALIAQARALPGSFDDRLLDIFMTWARNMEVEKGGVDVVMMDDMRQHYYHPTHQSTPLQGTPLYSTFEGKTILFGIASYVGHICRNGSFNPQHDGGAALQLALMPFTESSYPDMVAATSHRVLQHLLNHGASPNQQSQGSSVFQKYLDLYSTAESESSSLGAASRASIDALPLLLAHGAAVADAFEGPAFRGRDCWFTKLISNEQHAICPIKSALAQPSALLRTLRTLLDAAGPARFDVNRPLLDHDFGGKSPWQLLLIEAVENQICHALREDFFVEILLIFLERGADPAATVQVATQDIYDAPLALRDGCLLPTLPWMPSYEAVVRQRRATSPESITEREGMQTDVPLAGFACITVEQLIHNFFDTESRALLEPVLRRAQKSWLARGLGDRDLRPQRSGQGPRRKRGRRGGEQSPAMSAVAKEEKRILRL